MKDAQEYLSINIGNKNEIVSIKETGILNNKGENILSYNEIQEFQKKPCFIEQIEWNGKKYCLSFIKSTEREYICLNEQNNPLLKLKQVHKILSFKCLKDKSQIEEIGNNFF